MCLLLESLGLNPLRVDFRREDAQVRSLIKLLARLLGVLREVDEVRPIHAHLQKLVFLNQIFD